MFGAVDVHGPCATIQSALSAEKQCEGAEQNERVKVRGSSSNSRAICRTRAVLPAPELPVTSIPEAEGGKEGSDPRCKVIESTCHAPAILNEVSLLEAKELMTCDLIASSLSSTPARVGRAPRGGCSRMLEVEPEGDLGSIRALAQHSRKLCSATFEMESSRGSVHSRRHDGVLLVKLDLLWWRSAQPRS